MVSLTFPDIGALGVCRCTASLSTVARSSKASISVPTDLRKLWSCVLGIDFTSEIRRASTREVPGGSLSKGQGHEEGDDGSELHSGGCWIMRSERVIDVRLNLSEQTSGRNV